MTAKKLVDPAIPARRDGERRRNMKVMVLVKANEGIRAGTRRREADLRDDGVQRAAREGGRDARGEGLKASSEGKRVRFLGSAAHGHRRPFAETKELLAGYWLWQVRSMEEAIEWVKRCPNPHNEECELEIRPVFDSVDCTDISVDLKRRGEARARRWRSRGASLLRSHPEGLRSSG
jgi:hypothetical protein